MSQLLNEIDSIIDLLESKLPASPLNPDNRKLAKAFQSSLVNYFKSLEQAFPFQKLMELYLKQVREVAPPKPKVPSGEWDEWLDSLLNAFKTDLKMSVGSHLVSVYLTGSTQVMSYGKTKMGIPILYEGPPISQAVNWARDYGAGLVTNMDIETKSRLAQIISDGIENKRGIDGLARDIRKEFEDMSVTRSKLIANTETANALGQSVLDRGEAMGVDGKEWILGSGGRSGNCEDCIANADAGIIPIDEPFPSGHMTTSAHPGCTCAVSLARLNPGD